MKRLLSLALTLIGVVLLASCAGLTRQLMFVTDTTYNEETDVTSIEVYYLEEDAYYTTHITGTEYEATNDGYICVLFRNSRIASEEDIITIQDLNDCE